MVSSHKTMAYGIALTCMYDSYDGIKCEFTTRCPAQPIWDECMEWPSDPSIEQ